MKRLKLPSCFRFRQHFPVRRDGCSRRSQRNSSTNYACHRNFHQGISSPGGTIHTGRLLRRYQWATPAAASRHYLTPPWLPAAINPPPRPPLLVPAGPDRTTRRLSAVPPVLPGQDPATVLASTVPTAPRSRGIPVAHAEATGRATRLGDGSDTRTAQRNWPATKRGARRTARTGARNFKLNARNVRPIATNAAYCAKPSATKTAHRPCRSPL